MKIKTISLLMILIVMNSCNDADIRDQPLSVKELLLEYNDTRRLISSEQLADLIINKDPGIRIVDVRDQDQYELFSLPGAFNIPLDQIISQEFNDILDCERFKIVCYSNSDVLADRAWMVRRELGCKDIYVLEGGLNSWVENIFHPVEPEPMSPSEEIESYNMRVAMRNYFLGLSQELKAEQFTRPRPKRTVVVTPKKVVEDEEEEGC